MPAISMFPLGMPLLPGSAVPLHVFEPRYVTMVRDLLAGDASVPEFGVVMIERGFEVGGGDVRSDVGTVARLAEIEALPGPRYAMLAVGTERFRVLGWLPDDPYPRAEVELWPDESGERTSAEQIAEVVEAATSLNALARELGHNEVPDLSDVDLPTHLARTLFRLASLTPLGPADRQRVLAAPTVNDRCAALVEVIADARAVLEFRRS